MKKIEQDEMHFLVVDDDLDARAATVEYLKSMGFLRISEASDGDEAIRILELNPSVNFIISDWQMPIMDGLGLLQRIRSDVRTAQMPFLMVTSPVSQEAEKIVLAAENMVNAYLIKPFRGEVLKEKIDLLLRMAVYGPTKEVLVVDDDPDAREMVEDYLKQMGFRNIHSVNNGKQALDYINSNRDKIGLVISDWEMPEMNGVELLRACKTAKGLSDVPFIMITSQTSMERMKVIQAAKAEVDQYVLKPFTAGELKKRINDLLGRHRHKHEISKLLAEGAEHEEYGRYRKAEDVYRRILKIDSKSEAALRGLGDALVKTKGVEAALDYYKKAVEASPLSVKSNVRLAMAYEQLGFFDNAMALLQSAIRQISFSPELHFNLGRLYNKRGDLQSAKAEFEKTLEIQLDHQEARLMLEMIASRKKK